MHLRGANSHYLSCGVELSAFLVGCTMLSLAMLLLTPYLDVQYYLAAWKKKNEDAYVYTLFEHVVQECENVNVFHFNRDNNNNTHAKKIKNKHINDNNNNNNAFNKAVCAINYENEDPITLEQVIIV